MRSLYYFHAFEALVLAAAAAASNTQDGGRTPEMELVAGFLDGTKGGSQRQRSGWLWNIVSMGVVRSKTRRYSGRGLFPL